MYNVYSVSENNIISSPYIHVFVALNTHQTNQNLFFPYRKYTNYKLKQSCQYTKKIYDVERKQSLIRYYSRDSWDCVVARVTPCLRDKIHGCIFNDIGLNINKLIALRCEHNNIITQVNRNKLTQQKAP